MQAFPVQNAIAGGNFLYSIPAQSKTRMDGNIILHGKFVFQYDLKYSWMSPSRATWTSQYRLSDIFNILWSTYNTLGGQAVCFWLLSLFFKDCQLTIVLRTGTESFGLILNLRRNWRLNCDHRLVTLNKTI